MSLPQPISDPVFAIGSLVLRPSYGHEPDRVWLEQAATGEGADFPVDQVEAVLQAYYDEHF